MTDPFRTSSPPCTKCEAREKADLKLEPFQESNGRKCPECMSYAYQIFQIICTGSGRFCLNKGFWFFHWWGRDEFECKLKESPKHIHFICKTCNNSWMMRTATEEVKKA